MREWNRARETVRVRGPGGMRRSEDHEKRGDEETTRGRRRFRVNRSFEFGCRCGCGCGFHRDHRRPYVPPPPGWRVRRAKWWGSGGGACRSRCVVVSRVTVDRWACPRRECKSPPVDREGREEGNGSTDIFSAVRTSNQGRMETASTTGAVLVAVTIGTTSSNESGCCSCS